MGILVVGGVIFAADPSDFSKFSYCGLAGTTVVAGTLLLIGFTLWLTD
jgi:hypothetical protein